MMRNEKPGGHGERATAVGVLDMALWDIAAKIEQKPLYRLIAERFHHGAADERVYVYAAGGYYYPGKGLDELRSEMQRYLDLGYSDVKIKIGGAPLAGDLARIEAILPMLPRGGKLAVDANGRFDRDTALEYGRRLNEYDLKWYEEPCDPLDYEIMADVARESRLPCATGENLFSFQDARNLIRYGGMQPERDYLQMDCALGYGLVEYLRILEMLGDYGWSARRCVPHGGHQMALHIAAGMGLGGNESYPGVFEPFGGFADNVAVEDGKVALPDAPGIGMELKAGLYQVLQRISG
jgi:L-alanine-DL-glutamate epimerase-like enolase superfamily enzyme